MSTDVFDLTIVGAGPAGLFSAYYAGLRGLRVKIVDSLDQPGGQLIALYPEKFIYDVAGFPAVLAKTLVNELVKQASQYKPVWCMGEQVQTCEQHKEGCLAIGTNRSTHWSRAVVIAAGAGAFAPKKLPGVNCSEYEGRGVSYSVRELAAWRDKRVLVVGGGDSAVDWALNLLRFTEHVTLIHRTGKFRAHEGSIAKLMASPDKVSMFHELKGVDGVERVEEVTIYDNRTKEEERLAVDGVLVNIGFSSSLGPIRDWGVELDKEGIVVGSRMETNVAGVYAAGDVASYPGKLKLIVTGFGDAATAVNHAKAFIDPASRSFPGHSTSVVPKQRQDGDDGK